MLSGCAGGQFLLQGKEKTLNLDQDHGMAIITSTFVNPNVVTPQACIVREVNQYKTYKDAKVYSIPLARTNYNAKTGSSVIPLLLPKGKYVFQGYLGMFRPNWITNVQANMGASAVFDVNPGVVSYAGHVTFDNEVKNQPPCQVKLDDNYDQDVSNAKNSFPVLHGKDVQKNLFYN
jgi:hypothetical protein